MPKFQVIPQTEQLFIVYEYHQGRIKKEKKTKNNNNKSAS